MLSARWLGLLAAGLGLAPLVLPPFFLQLLTEIAIVGLFATAFNLLMGFGGMVSFGPAAYFALGGYAAALLDVWPPAFLKSPVAYYYFALAVVALCLLALRAIVESPFGYALTAVRENPRRARFIGINVRRHQLLAFVVSGAFSGMAGGLFA